MKRLVTPKYQGFLSILFIGLLSTSLFSATLYDQLVSQKNWEVFYIDNGQMQFDVELCFAFNSDSSLFLLNSSSSNDSITWFLRDDTLNLASISKNDNLPTINGYWKLVITSDTLKMLGVPPGFKISGLKGKMTIFSFSSKIPIDQTVIYARPCSSCIPTNTIFSISSSHPQKYSYRISEHSISLTTPTENRGNINIRVYNAMGRELRFFAASQKPSIERNTTTWYLNSNLKAKSGAYFVNFIQDGKTVASHRFIIK